MVCRSSGLTTCCRQPGSFSRTDAWTPAPGVATGQCWGGPSNVWSGRRCTGLAHQHWLSSALILQDLGVGQYADHGWVEAQLSSGGLSSAWHFGGSNSQVSVSRAFLFPYLEEWGEDRARSFRLHLQVLFSPVIREEPKRAPDLLPSSHPQASFWPHYKVWLETQVNSLQPKFGSVFEMLPVRWGSWFTKRPQMSMKSLKAAVTVSELRPTAALYSWPLGEGL